MLITNHHHVLPTKEAAGVGANFKCEYASAGLSSGSIFELDPDGFFIADETLDFALVGVSEKFDGGVQSEFGFVPLIESTGKILVRDGSTSS